jgi:hypothetical protein
MWKTKASNPSLHHVVAGVAYAVDRRLDPVHASIAMHGAAIPQERALKGEGRDENV